MAVWEKKVFCILLLLSCAGAVILLDNTGGGRTPLGGSSFTYGRYNSSGVATYSAVGYAFAVPANKQLNITSVTVGLLNGNNGTNLRASLYTTIRSSEPYWDGSPAVASATWFVPRMVAQEYRTFNLPSSSPFLANARSSANWLVVLDTAPGAVFDSFQLVSVSPDSAPTSAGSYATFVGLAKANNNGFFSAFQQYFGSIRLEGESSAAPQPPATPSVTTSPSVAPSPAALVFYDGAPIPIYDGTAAGSIVGTAGSNALTATFSGYGFSLLEATRYPSLLSTAYF